MAVIRILFLLAVTTVTVKSSCAPTKLCGQRAELMPTYRYELPPGQITIEKIALKTCFGRSMTGFEATVCMDSTMPKVTCMDYDKVMVDKNGSKAGTIKFTVYCSTVIDDSTERKHVQRYYHDRHRYYNNRGYYYDSRDQSNRNNYYSDKYYSLRE